MKKTLALILGAIMLMGCLSVSAANSALIVTDKPMKPIYFEDFSAETLDNTHVTLGGGAVLENGALVAKNPVAETRLFDVVMAPEGIKEPVYLEFDVSQSGIKNVPSAQIKIHVHSTKGEFMQYRWYNDRNPFIRTMGAWSSTGAISYKPWKDIVCTGDTAKFKMYLNPLTGKFKVWVNNELFIDEDEKGLRGEEEVPYLYSTGNFVDLQSLKILANSASIPSVKLDNVKVYSAEELTVPAVGEVIYHHTFDSATVDSSMVEVVGASTVSQSTEVDGKQVATGNLYVSTSANGDTGAKIYLQPSHEALTGKYVVEFNIAGIVHNSDAYHRLTFGEATSYVRWCTREGRDSSTGVYYTKELKYRFYGQDPQYTDFTGKMADFDANGSSLKVTHLYDTTQGTVDVWFNDIYAGKISSTNAKHISIPYFYANMYKGSISISDLIVYRPATYNYDANTGLSITEDDETVTFATNAAKAGNLYFASYADDTLAAIGTAALSLEPGKTYTVAKPNWPGIKAFFWDADLKPITNAWDLQ